MVTKSPQRVNPLGKLIRKKLTTISIVLQSIIVLILSLFLIPLVLPLLIPIYIFRYIVFKFSCYLRPTEKMLASRSAMFASDDLYKKPLCTVVGKIDVDGTLEIDKHREMVQKFWLDSKYANGELKHPELRQYITTYLGFRFWRWEKDFNIEEHVKLMDRKYIKSGSYPTESEVMECMTDLSLEPFKEKTSPWKLVLTEVGPGKYVTITCWHHSLTDGLGLMKLFANTYDIEVKNIPQQLKTSQQKPKRNFFLPLIQILRAPYDTVKGPIESRDSISSNSWHLPETELKRQWTSVFADELVPIELVKELKNSYNVTFNCIIFSVITGAVRNFMLTKKNRKIPQFIHAGIPVPAAGQPGKHHPDKLRNFWSICTIKLPVGEPNPIVRLHYINRKLKELRRSTLPMTAFLLMPFMGSVFNPIIKLLMKNKNTTMILSVMPGPNGTIQNNLGHKVHDAGFLVALGDGNTGFGMSAFTYAGQVKFGATMDHAFVTDPKIEVKNLANGATTELQNLKHLMKTEV